MAGVVIVGDAVHVDVLPAADRINELGEPKIEHLDRTVLADFDVRRLQIAVNDPLLVGGFQCLCDLFGNRECLVQRNRALGDPIRERRALDQLHHERVGAAGVFNAVDVRDVGMVQSGEDLGFSVEPGETLRLIGDKLRENLDRDVPPELRIPGAIDLPHPAAAEQRRDFVRAEAGAGLQGHDWKSANYPEGSAAASSDNLAATHSSAESRGAEGCWEGSVTARSSRCSYGRPFSQIRAKWKRSIFLGKLAPQAGFEAATLRLTAWFRSSCCMLPGVAA